MHGRATSNSVFFTDFSEKLDTFLVIAPGVKGLVLKDGITRDEDLLCLLSQSKSRCQKGEHCLVHYVQLIHFCSGV